jgi:voltage-gated potassium channel Kch
MNNRHRSLLALEREHSEQTQWWHTLWRCHIKPFWRDQQWLITALLWVITICLGCIGFSKNRAATGQIFSFWDVLYLTLQLFTLESGNVHALYWELDLARFLAPFVAALTAVQAAALIFHEQVQKLFLRFLSGHVIICGMGRKGILASEEFRRRGYHVVAIEVDEGSDAIRLCREEGMTVITGNAAEVTVLRRSHPERAAYLVVLTGDDGYNAGIAANARKMVSGKRKKVLNTIVHIGNPALYRLLKEQELAAHYEHLFRLQFFNSYDTGALVLMGKFPPFGSGTDGRAPHLVLAGKSPLAAHIVGEAARQWKKQREKSEALLTITLVSPDAADRVEILKSRHPSLLRYCTLREVMAPLQSACMEKALFLYDEQGTMATDCVYICTNDDTEAMTAALALMNRTGAHDIPIIVQMSRGEGLASLLKSMGGQGLLQRLSPFPLVEETCTFELLLGGSNEIIARAMHDDYMKDRQAQGLSHSDRRSLAPWDELPECHRKPYLSLTCKD